MPSTHFSASVHFSRLKPLYSRSVDCTRVNLKPFVTADSKLIVKKMLLHRPAHERRPVRTPWRIPPRIAKRGEATLRTRLFSPRLSPGGHEAEKEFHRIRKYGGWEFGEWRRVIFLASVNSTVRIRTHVSGKPQIPRSGLPVKTQVHSPLVPRGKQEWLCHEAQLCGPAIDPNRAYIYFTATVNRNVIC